MTIAEQHTAEPPESPARVTETFADLVWRLGDISLDRIRTHPAPGLATEADVESIHDHEGRLFELMEGVLVEKAMGFTESLLAVFIVTALHGWVTPRKLGVVVGADGAVRLFGHEVRIPDGAYVSWERLGGKMPEDPIPLLAPDLVVEVLSKSNTKREMDRKRGEYFAAGVRLLWEVDGKTRTVAVYTTPVAPRVLAVGDMLDGGEVLPGFTLSLAELFAAGDK